jgi:hypothetical protein
MLYAEPERLSMELKGTLGYASFPDESPLHHFVGGGSARFYFTEWLAVEPEFLHMYRNRSDQDFHFIPNIVLDLRPIGSRIRPYAIGGAGLQLHRELTWIGPYTSKSPTYNGGFGTKIFLTERWFISPEIRLGWEPLLRVTASIGYVVPSRKR